MKRILAIGVGVTGGAFPPAQALAPDGTLIVMDSNAQRTDAVRKHLAAAGIEERAIFIGGDPRRMLYKLAGPFDMIVVGDCDASMRPRIESLLTAGGVLVDRGQTP
jgi:predicted O-methyltransferase YrrM